MTGSAWRAGLPGASGGAPCALAAWAFAGALLACCSPPASAPGIRPSEQKASLVEGSVARVGEEPIAGTSVAAIASAQGISIEVARSRAIFDALMAAGARREGYESRPEVRAATRAVLARALVTAIKRQAAERPIGDEEIDRLTELHWLDMDRPVAHRTVHAVVRVPEGADADAWRSAGELARRIAEAVRGAPDAATFIARASEQPSYGLEVTVEELSPVTAQGWVADLVKRPPAGAPTQAYDPQYVDVAFKLQRAGDQSPPVRTRFGWHVVMLTEVQPELRVGYEQRKQLLRDEIMASRAKQVLDPLLGGLRARHRPRLERNAESALALVASGARDAR
jgi:hypothetical protein